jgi:hypothetical protein
MRRLGAGSRLFTQDSPGVPYAVDFDEFFGDPLAALPVR